MQHTGFFCQFNEVILYKYMQLIGFFCQFNEILFYENIQDLTPILDFFLFYSLITQCTSFTRCTFYLFFITGGEFLYSCSGQGAVRQRLSSNHTQTSLWLGGT